MAGTTDSMMAQKLVEFLQLNETKNKENEAALQRVAALQAENQQSACHIRQQQQELHAKDNELQRVAELEGGRNAELQRCMRQLAAAKTEAKELSAKLSKAETSRDDNAALAAACKEDLNSSNGKVGQLAAELAAAQACKASQADVNDVIDLTTGEELNSSQKETERLNKELNLAAGRAAAFAIAKHGEDCCAQAAVPGRAQ